LVIKVPRFLCCRHFLIFLTAAELFSTREKTAKRMLCISRNIFALELKLQTLQPDYFAADIREQSTALPLTPGF
jgi:hypothetical protein